MGVIPVSLGSCFVHFSIAVLRSGVMTNAAIELSALEPLRGKKAFLRSVEQPFYKCNLFINK